MSTGISAALPIRLVANERRGRDQPCVSIAVDMRISHEINHTKSP